RFSGSAQPVPLPLVRWGALARRKLHPLAGRVFARGMAAVQERGERRPLPHLLRGVILVRVRGEQPHRDHLHQAASVARLLDRHAASDGRSTRAKQHRGSRLTQQPPKVKVLCITNMYPTEADPSTGSFVRDLVEDVRALDVEVEVLAFDGRKRKRAYAEASLDLRRALRGGRFDLIHAHYGLTGALAVGQRSIPAVVTFHGSDTGNL